MKRKEEKKKKKSLFRNRFHVFFFFMSEAFKVLLLLFCTVLHKVSTSSCISLIMHSKHMCSHYNDPFGMKRKEKKYLFRNRFHVVVFLCRKLLIVTFVLHVLHSTSSCTSLIMHSIKHMCSHYNDIMIPFGMKREEKKKSLFRNRFHVVVFFMSEAFVTFVLHVLHGSTSVMLPV